MNTKVHLRFTEKITLFGDIEIIPHLNLGQGTINQQVSKLIDDTR